MSTLDWWRTGTIYQVYIRPSPTATATAPATSTACAPSFRTSPISASTGSGSTPGTRHPARRWLRRSRLPRHPPVVRHARGRRRDDRRGPRVGIRILVDLVPNHCSWDHVWFKAALRPLPARLSGHASTSPRARSPTTARSIRRTTGNRSSGSAWTQVDDGQWYLHLFDPSQPDLDWTHPEVREEFRRSCVSGLTAAPTVSVSMSPRSRQGHGLPRSRRPCPDLQRQTAQPRALGPRRTP